MGFFRRVIAIVIVPHRMDLAYRDVILYTRELNYGQISQIGWPVFLSLDIITDEMYDSQYLNL